MLHNHGLNEKCILLTQILRRKVNIHIRNKRIHTKPTWGFNNPLTCFQNAFSNQSLNIEEFVRALNVLSTNFYTPNPKSCFEIEETSSALCLHYNTVSNTAFIKYSRKLALLCYCRIKHLYSFAFISRYSACLYFFRSLVPEYNCFSKLKKNTNLTELYLLVVVPFLFNIGHILSTTVHFC